MSGYSFHGTNRHTETISGSDAASSQLLLAANAPMLARRAMTEGDPIGGYLPSGSVAGLIDDEPTCQELVDRIRTEALETISRLQC